MSSEYHTRGPVALNGNGAMPVPTGPPNHMQSGQAGHMGGGTGVGPYDMPRSPPSAKSMLHSSSTVFDLMLVKPQVHLMCHANSTGKEHVRPAKPALSSTPQTQPSR